MSGSIGFVRYATHKQATSAVRGQKRALSLAYNECKYDGEQGRGWPQFEQGAALTIASHLFLAKQNGILPGRFEAAETRRPKVIDVSGGSQRVLSIPPDPKMFLATVMGDIDAAIFTGKGDRCDRPLSLAVLLEAPL